MRQKMSTKHGRLKIWTRIEACMNLGSGMISADGGRGIRVRIFNLTLAVAYATDGTKLLVKPVYEPVSKSPFWAPSYVQCTRIRVRAMIGRLKIPLSICQSG